MKDIFTKTSKRKPRVNKRVIKVLNLDESEPTLIKQLYYSRLKIMESYRYQYPPA